MTGDIAKLRTHVTARVDEIKADLTTHIEQNTDALNDSAEVSMALLEMAINRYIDLHGEQDAHFLIGSAFRRATARKG